MASELLPDGLWKQLTGAKRNDSWQTLSLVDAIPSLQGMRGRRRCRPDCVLGDRGYDAEAIRQGLRARNIFPFRDAQYQAWEWTRAMAMGG